MDLKQLAAVLAVVEVGSVTRAAHLLHLVQPAVTRQIRALEHELGVTLFNRTRQGMTPTAGGLMLAERARRVLHELDRARAELRSDSADLTGLVTVGLLESVIDTVVQPFAALMAERYPGVRLRILTAYSGHLEQWLSDGDIDVCLVYNLSDTRALTAEPVLDEALWAVAPPGSELRPDKPVTWAAAFAQPLTLPVAGNGLRVLIDQARAQSSAQLHKLVETNSMQVQKRLVQAGQGWTVLPASGVFDDVTAGVLTGAPLTDPEITRSVVIATRSGTRTSPVVTMAADELATLIRELVESGTWPSARLTPRRKA